MEKYANVRLTVQQRTEYPCTNHEGCDSAAGPEEFDLDPSEMGRRNTKCERRQSMRSSMRLVTGSGPFSFALRPLVDRRRDDGKPPVA
jgi:hypothetical protein